QRPVHRPGTREFFPLVPGGNRAFIVPWFVGRARRTNPSTPASTAEGVSVVPSTLRSSPRPARAVRPAVAAALTAALAVPTTLAGLAPAQALDVTPIADIQGTGDASPLVGETVTTRGVVTAVYPTGGFNGF